MNHRTATLLRRFASRYDKHLPAVKRAWYQVPREKRNLVRQALQEKLNTNV